MLPFLASHCFDPKLQYKVKEAHTIFSRLGRLNISDDHENGSVTRNILEIYNNPKWNSTDYKYDGDISILSLDHEIIFSDSIQPICLPHFETIFTQTEGFVVGHGLDDSKKISETQKHIQIGTHEYSTCLVTDEGLKSVGALEMICAGEHGKIPCKGRKLILK